MRRSTSRMRRALIAVGVVLCVTAVAVAVYYSPGNRFMRKYRNLQIGMDENQVEQLFDKSPEYTCYYGRLRICYFRRPMFPGENLEFTEEKAPQEAQFADSSELPYIYAAAQVAFDHNNQLVAYTLNGETHEIVTSKGRFPGSQFDQIPTDILDSL